MTDLERLLSPDECKQLASVRFKPVMLLKMLGLLLNKAEKNGQIDSITKMGIDQNIDRLSGIVGGCERIANTPIPFPYHVLLHRTVYIYCLLLRITSYNVCYTKLLRFLPYQTGLRENSEERQLLCPIPFRSVLYCSRYFKIFQPALSRITSYNVCYTKLLRTWIGSISNIVRMYTPPLVRIK